MRIWDLFDPGCRIFLTLDAGSVKKNLKSRKSIPDPQLRGK
jgi:hypothetical protein